MRRGKALLRASLALALITAGLFGWAIAFGTATPPPEHKAISAPFREVDFSDLPALERLVVSHGSPIAFRRYGEARQGAVIAIHGSTALSASLHPLAKGIAEAGYAVYVPDLRGHGETGKRGDLDYAGQLDDDLKALIHMVKERHPAARLALTGFSIGGGFALRFAAAYPEIKLDRIVLIAPSLGRKAPSTRLSGDSWAAPHVPRIVALTVLSKMGLRAFDHLEAIAFAVPPGSDKNQVRSYSFRLLNGLLPDDYGADLKRLRAPTTALIGEKDELFSSGLIVRAFGDYGFAQGVTIVPDLNHIEMTVDARGIAAVVKALGETP